MEETGYEAQEYVLWKSLQPVSKIEWAVYVFVARGLKKVSDLHLDAGEKIELMEKKSVFLIDHNRPNLINLMLEIKAQFDRLRAVEGQKDPVVLEILIKNKIKLT